MSPCPLKFSLSITKCPLSIWSVQSRLGSSRFSVSFPRSLPFPVNPEFFRKILIPLIILNFSKHSGPKFILVPELPVFSYEFPPESWLPKLLPASGVGLPYFYWEIYFYLWTVLANLFLLLYPAVFPLCPDVLPLGWCWQCDTVSRWELFIRQGYWWKKSYEVSRQQTRELKIMHFPAETKRAPVALGGQSLLKKIMDQLQMSRATLMCLPAHAREQPDRPIKLARSK